MTSGMKLYFDDMYNSEYFCMYVVVYFNLTNDKCFSGTPNLEIVDVPANVEVVVAPADGINSVPDQVQDCRSAPYTSVGGVPRNSAEPPATKHPSGNNAYLNFAYLFIIILTMPT